MKTFLIMLFWVCMVVFTGPFGWALLAIWAIVKIVRAVSGKG